MVFETIYNLVLQFFHSLGFLEPVSLCDHSQGSNAGEGRNVDVHILQVGGEFNNGINPFPKATNALQPVQDHPIAKDEFTLHWVGPVC